MALAPYDPNREPLTGLSAAQSLAPVDPIPAAAQQVQQQRLERAANRPGLLGSVARNKLATVQAQTARPGNLGNQTGSFSVSTGAQNDLSEANRINTLAGAMQRDRMQREEQLGARRLQQDQMSNARLARYNAGLAAGTSADPRNPSRFATETATRAQSFQGLADQQAQQLQNGGSLQSVLARQGQENAALTNAGADRASQENIANQQLQQQALRNQQDMALRRDQFGVDQQRLSIDQQRADTAQQTAEAQLRNKALTPFQERQEVNAANELDKVQSVASKARQTIPLIAEAAGINEEGVTGALTKPKAFVANLFAGVSPGAADYATKVQRLESISSQLALGNKDVLEITGVLSDTDVKLLQSTVVNASNTQEANQRILESQLNLQKLALARADALSKATSAEEYRQIKENFGKEELAGALETIYSAAITDEQQGVIQQLGVSSEDIVTTARENNMTPEQVIARLQQQGQQ